MNEATLALVRDLTARLEREIRARECVAMVALEGERTLVLSDYDYGRTEAAAHAFEDKAAAQARLIKATRFVFAVPQVWMITGDDVATRAVSNHPLRPGEEEAITWMSFDANAGVDYGRVPYTRQDGEPIFDEPQWLAIPMQPDEHMPGLRLLRALTADDNDRGLA